MQILMKQLAYRVFKNVTKTFELKKASLDGQEDARGDEKDHHGYAQNIIIYKAESVVESVYHIFHLKPLHNKYENRVHHMFSR